MRYENPFQLLMAVILSAQATDVSVAKVTPTLFKRYPNPESVVASSTEEIEPYIRSIGLYRNKAKYIYKSSQQLLEWFSGKVPSTRKELETLTGIGSKSANMLLSVAVEKPAFEVGRAHVGTPATSPARMTPPTRSEELYATDR